MSMSTTARSVVGLGLFMQDAGIKIPEPKKQHGVKEAASLPTSTIKLVRYPAALVKLHNKFHKLSEERNGQIFLEKLLVLLEQDPSEYLDIHVLYGLSQLVHILCDQLSPEEQIVFKGKYGIIGYVLELKKKAVEKFGSGWMQTEPLPNIRDFLVKEIRVKLGKDKPQQ